MNCYSRSTLGIIIGSLTIIACIFLTIYSSFLLAKTADLSKKEVKDTRTVFIIVLISCLITVVTSSLLIMGIVKKRHKLMQPWLFQSGITFMLQCVEFIFKFFGSIFVGASPSIVFGHFFGGVFRIGISALITYPVFTLYRDMRLQNTETPGRRVDFA